VLSNEPGPTGAKADGFAAKLKSFDCVLAFTVAHKVFVITEELSTTLQNSELSLQGARENVKSVTQVLRSMRTEDQFLAVWTETTELADKLNFKPPKLPRTQNIPRRIDDGCSAVNYSDCVTYHRVETWYRLIDCILGQLDSRFSEVSFEHIVHAEELLMKAVQGLPFTDELRKFSLFYDDFDSTRLEIQLQNLQQSSLTKNLQLSQFSVLAVTELLKNTPGSHVFLSEVCKLAKLLLVVPVSAASAERSFSSLRRLKTYLRATMGQPRLNNMLLLHCHKERTDKLNLEAIAQTFISAVESRSKFFGNFNK
jgi:hypothetical protein